VYLVIYDVSSLCQAPTITIKIRRQNVSFALPALPLSVVELRVSCTTHARLWTMVVTCTHSVPLRHQLYQNMVRATYAPAKLDIGGTDRGAAAGPNAPTL
jgi:hypothetical protein